MARLEPEEEESVLSGWEERTAEDSWLGCDERRRGRGEGWECLGGLGGRPGGGGEAGAASSASSIAQKAGLTLEIATVSLLRPGIATLKLTSLRLMTR